MEVFALSVSCFRVQPASDGIHPVLIYLVSRSVKVLCKNGELLPVNVKLLDLVVDGERCFVGTISS